MVGDPAEAVERESRGLWGKTGQRSLERSACLALLVRKPATKVRFWPIVLKKSFWGVERSFLEPLMRFTRGDVRGHIDSSKIDHGPS